MCRGRAGVRGGTHLCSSVHVCLCVRVRVWQTHKGGRVLSFQKRCGDISEDVHSGRSGDSQRPRAPCPRRSLDPHAGPFGSDLSHLPRFPGRGLRPERRRPGPASPARLGWAPQGGRRSPRGREGTPRGRALLGARAPRPPPRGLRSRRPLPSPSPRAPSFPPAPALPRRRRRVIANWAEKGPDCVRAGSAGVGG